MSLWGPPEGPAWSRATLDDASTTMPSTKCPTRKGVLRDARDQSCLADQKKGVTSQLLQKLKTRYGFGNFGLIPEDLIMKYSSTDWITYAPQVLQ